MSRYLLYLSLILFFNSLDLFSQSSSGPYLVGYWQNWDDANSPYIALDQIDNRYKVVNLSFAIGGNGTDYDMVFELCCGETQAGLLSKIQSLQANGVIVNISVGGATAPVELDNVSETNTFVSSMNTIINTYELDGLDIDLEGSSLSVSASSTIANPTDAKVTNFISAIQQITTTYQSTHGKKMFLSAAPETAFVQGGQSSWGGLWGAYLPVLDALRDDLDLLHVQLYNSGSMFGIDGNIYTQGTADFIIAQVEAVIVGFGAGAGGTFEGFPESKVAVALPACPSAAGGGFTSTATVKTAIDYLMGNGDRPGSYTLQGGPYPNLGGMMTWSINWDAVTSCNSTAYEYAGNYKTIFPDHDCQQPNLGTDISACGLTFPYTLNSQTTINTNVTFTWTNLSTNTVLVNNSATATTLDISTAGTYQVSRDSAGCSKTDVINVSADLAIPTLPTTLDLCLTIPASITVSNTNGFPNGTTWLWYKDDVVIADAVSSTYADIRSAGTYKVEATYGDCTTENSLIVSSDLPEPIDACGNAGSSVTLGINGDGVDNYEWYATATGGIALGTGETFTTPVLSETMTYYVGSTDAVGNVTTGPMTTDNGLGSLGNFFSPKELYFDVSTDFTLKGLTIYPLIYCGTHTISLEIKDGDNALLPNGQHDFSLSGDADCSALDTTPQTVSFGDGISISQGTDYKIIITSTVGVSFWEGNVSFPMEYTPFFSITGSDVANRYLAIHDWEVEGEVCARLPVIATISGDCANGCSNERTLNESITTGTYHAATTIESAGTIANNTTVIFKAGTSITLTDGFHAMSGGTFAASIESCSADLVDDTNQELFTENRASVIDNSMHFLENESIMVIAPSVKIFPNPAKAATTFAISLSQPIVTNLNLIDLQGRKINTFFNNTLLEAGLHEYYWDCTAVEAGIYFLVLNGQFVGRLVVVK